MCITSSYHKALDMYKAQFEHEEKMEIRLFCIENLAKLRHFSVATLFLVPSNCLSHDVTYHD